MVASEMEEVRARRFSRGRRKMGLKVPHYRKVFQGDKLVKCSGLEKLRLMAVEMLKRKAVRERVMRFDAEKKAAVDIFQKTVEYDRRQGSKNDKSGIDGSSSKSEAGDNPEKP